MNVLQAVAFIVAILAGLGSAAAFLSVGRQRGRIAALESSASDLRNDVVDRDRRITFLEGENRRHEEVEKAQKETIEHLREEVRVLRSNWTGAEGPISDIRRRVVMIDAGVTKLLNKAGETNGEGVGN